MVLVRDDAPTSQSIGEVRVVLASEGQVDLRGPPEIEGGPGIAEDAVQVGGHPPTVAFAREQVECKGGPAQHVGVPGLRAEASASAAEPMPGSAVTRSQTPISRATSIRLVR